MRTAVSLRHRDIGNDDRIAPARTGHNYRVNTGFVKRRITYLIKEGITDMLIEIYGVLGNVKLGIHKGITSQEIAEGVFVIRSCV
jgi:hypothetical protein